MVGEWVGVGALSVEFFLGQFGGFVVSVCFAVVFAFLALVGVVWERHGGIVGNGVVLGWVGVRG